MERSWSVALRLLLAALLFAENLHTVNSSPVREASKELQEDWLNTALRYMETNPETLQDNMAPTNCLDPELLSNHHTVLEGDMMMSTDRNAVERTWPTRDIPYVISLELVGRTEDIVSAVSMISEHTCLTFHRRTTETSYLLFKTARGCASYVGYIGMEQPVFVAPQCIVGNIVHEVLHALGFHHEHTRTDREQYITILLHNVMKGLQNNFQKRQGNTFNLDYDVTSIMHYGGWFFSANGLPTIISIKDTKEMGQRVRMTELDILRVRHLYKCNATETKTPKESGEEDKADSGSSAERIQSGKVSSNSTSTGNQSDVPSRGEPEENRRATVQYLDTTTGGRNGTSQTSGLG